MAGVEAFKTRNIEGLLDTVKLLQKFDKDGLKIMNKEIYQVMKKIQLEARGLMPADPPLTKWGLNPPDDYEPTKNKKWDQRRLQYVPRDARMGITTKIDSQKIQGNRTSRRYNIINKNPAGMVYEWAGRASGGSTSQGEYFIKRLGKRPSRTRGRVVWKAVYDNKDYALKEVTNAMNRAVDALNRKRG